jgi:hypothetical protein
VTAGLLQSGSGLFVVLSPPAVCGAAGVRMLNTTITDVSTSSRPMSAALDLDPALDVTKLFSDPYTPFPAITWVTNAEDLVQVRGEQWGQPPEREFPQVWPAGGSCNIVQHPCACSPVFMGRVPWGCAVGGHAAALVLWLVAIRQGTSAELHLPSRLLMRSCTVLQRNQPTGAPQPERHQHCAVQEHLHPALCLECGPGCWHKPWLGAGEAGCTGGRAE